MNVRARLRVKLPHDFTNATAVLLIKKEAMARLKDVKKVCQKFSQGSVTFRLGDLHGYEQGNGIETDLLVYRRALKDVYNCDLYPIHSVIDYTIKPMTMEIELLLSGE